MSVEYGVLSEEEHKESLHQPLPGGAPPPSEPHAAFQAVPKKLAPHSFLAFSICVAAVCGPLNVATLPCSLTAVVLSILVNESSLYTTKKQIN